MVKVNGVNGQPLDRAKYTSLLNEGSQESSRVVSRRTRQIHGIAFKFRSERVRVLRNRDAPRAVRLDDQRPIPELWNVKRLNARARRMGILFVLLSLGRITRSHRPVQHDEAQDADARGWKEDAHDGEGVDFFSHLRAVVAVRRIVSTNPDDRSNVTFTLHGCEAQSHD